MRNLSGWSVWAVLNWDLLNMKEWQSLNCNIWPLTKLARLISYLQITNKTGTQTTSIKFYTEKRSCSKQIGRTLASRVCVLWASAHKPNGLHITSCSTFNFYLCKNITAGSYIRFSICWLQCSTSDTFWNKTKLLHLYISHSPHFSQANVLYCCYLLVMTWSWMNSKLHHLNWRYI